MSCLLVPTTLHQHLSLHHPCKLQRWPKDRKCSIRPNTSAFRRRKGKENLFLWLLPASSSAQNTEHRAQSTEHPWLATSPNGLVFDDSTSDRFDVLEIMCPFFSEPGAALAALSISFCLHATGGDMSLKVSHPYYTKFSTI